MMHGCTIWPRYLRALAMPSRDARSPGSSGAQARIFFCFGSPPPTPVAPTTKYRLRSRCPICGSCSLIAHPGSPRRNMATPAIASCEKSRAYVIGSTKRFTSRDTLRIGSTRMCCRNCCRMESEMLGKTATRWHLQTRRCDAGRAAWNGVVM